VGLLLVPSGDVVGALGQVAQNGVQGGEVVLEARGDLVDDLLRAVAGAVVASGAGASNAGHLGQQIGQAGSPVDVGVVAQEADRNGWREHLRREVTVGGEGAGEFAFKHQVWWHQGAAAGPLGGGGRVLGGVVAVAVAVHG